MKNDVLAIACKPIKELTSEDIRVLKSEYLRIYNKPAPSRPSTTFLVGNVAWGLQAEAIGKNPISLRQEIFKKLKRIKHTKNNLQIGTQLIREWHGNTYRVAVTNEGYEYNNQTYSSLTPIARLITGSHISGPRFFGVSKPHDRK